MDAIARRGHAASAAVSLTDVARYPVLLSILSSGMSGSDPLPTTSRLPRSTDIVKTVRMIRFVPKADVQLPPSGFSTHPSDSAFAHSGRPFASARADADAQS
jgi:hypothetical protein